MQVVPTKVPTVAQRTLDEFAPKLLKGLEARAGIEPAHKGFADLSLTTWVPRLGRAAVKMSLSRPPRLSPWSGLERETRFELATLALARRCSTTELLPLVADSSIPGGGNEVKLLQGLELPQTTRWAPATHPRPANLSPRPQSLRRAYTTPGWQWTPLPDCV
jgi:hypothetical protein